jgi:ketosteroid isomerase-like protein
MNERYGRLARRDEPARRTMVVAAPAYLRQVVEAWNRCWLEGRLQDLRAFLHPDVVFTGPRFEPLARGADACAQSYSDFLARAIVHDFSAADYAVDVADHVAVVTYRWTIDYETGDARRRESGQDLVVFVPRDDRWLVAWRTQQWEPRGD